MAFNFIMLDKATPRKPEIFQISALVGISRREVFSMCAEWWIWCDDNSVEGVIKNLPPEIADDIVGCKGFGRSLLTVGWLQVSESGDLILPNSERWLSQSAKTRSQNAFRAEKSRQRKASVTKICDKSVTAVTKTCDGDVTNVTQKAHLYIEKEKEIEEVKEALNTREAGPLYDEFRVEAEFIAAWNNLSGVRRFGRMKLGAPLSRKLRDLMSDPEWRWGEAFSHFPLKQFADDSGWIPSIDWFLKPETLGKILDGNYDRPIRTGNRTQNHPGANDPARIRTGDNTYDFPVADPQDQAAPGDGGDGGSEVPF